MARARTIKPSFFKNEVLAQCQHHTRLVFVGVWTLADREGRLEDRPARIRAELFPYENLDVDASLNELQEHGFVLRYGKEVKYIQILNFKKHQSPHVKEGASTIPAPDLHGASTEQAVLIPLSPFPSPYVEGKPRAKPRRAIALPPDFLLTSERREYALRQGVQNPDKEFEAFRAHHEAHGKTMKSWDAAWRTWCLNAKKFRGNEPPRSAGSMGGVLR